MNGPHNVDLDRFRSYYNEEQGQPPGRNSIMWDTLTDTAMGPLLFPIATMQSALPAVGTAVNKYGLYKNDVIGRAIRTSWSLMRFLYDGGDIAQKEAQSLRNLHANIRGTHADGSTYHALNPKNFRIVPDTFLDGVIRIRKDIGKPLTEVEEEQLFQEYVQLCLLFGIRRKHIEPTLAEFKVYFEDLINNTLTYNETVDYLIGEGMETPIKLQRFKFLQPLLNVFHRTFLYPGMKVSAIGALHPLYRERFNIPWTDHDAAKYRKLCRRLGTLSRIVPRRLRTNPLVYLLMMGYSGPKLVRFEHLQKVEARKLEKEKLLKGEAVQQSSY